MSEHFSRLISDYSDIRWTGCGARGVMLAVAFLLINNDFATAADSFRGSMTSTAEGVRVDVGSVPASEKYEATVEIFNSCGYPLSLASVSSNCSCATVEFVQETIEPGGLYTAKVMLAISSEGPFERELRYTLGDDSINGFTLKLKGIALNRWHFEPPEVVIDNGRLFPSSVALRQRFESSTLDHVKIQVAAEELVILKQEMLHDSESPNAGLRLEFEPGAALNRILFKTEIPISIALNNEMTASTWLSVRPAVKKTILPRVVSGSVDRPFKIFLLGMHDWHSADTSIEILSQGGELLGGGEVERVDRGIWRVVVSQLDAESHFATGSSSLQLRVNARNSISGASEVLDSFEFVIKR